MSSGRRSMAGRIYQEKPSVPRSISFNNPEQRKIIYPIKGDTAFDPNQYGRKHLSPKHSAIHSIIFNDNYNQLMQEKDEIVKKLSTNKKSYERYRQNLNLSSNQQIHNYVDDYLRKQQISNKDSNIFQRSKSFHNESNFQNIQKIKKGHLFRHHSINQVLQPYFQKSQNQVLTNSRVQNNSGVFSPMTSNKIDSLEHELPSLSKDFPRYINPNHLNSIF